MAASLKQFVSIGQFLNYVNSYGFDNQECDWIGLALDRSADAHEFSRNASIVLGSEKADFLSQALANSAKEKQ